MKKNGYITEEEYQEAIADAVYDRIQTVSVESEQDSTPYSYFVDELIRSSLRIYRSRKDILTNRHPTFYTVVG